MSDFLQTFFLDAAEQTPGDWDVNRLDEPQDVPVKAVDPLPKHTVVEEKRKYLKIFCGDKTLARHWYYYHNPEE